MKLLIIVDMQNDFIDGSLGTAEAVEILPRVEAKLAAHKGPVLFTRDTHPANYMETLEGKNLPVPHCIAGTHGWEIHDTLKKYITEQPIDKPTFGSVALAERVAAMHQETPLDEVVLCGLCTDICVISNALLIKATLPELPITVDATCSAGVTPESHLRAVGAMKMCQINITE